MYHKLFSKIAPVAMVFAVYLAVVGNVFACSCPYLTICQTYSISDAVLVGKVEKIEQAKDRDFPVQNVTFTVDKIYKGNPEKTAVVQFSSGECGNTFEIGETYFVYQDKWRPCNNTKPLKYASEDVKYAGSLSAESPVFFIKGRIESSERERLPADELKNTRITIEKGEAKFNVEIDKFGKFDFKTTAKGIYLIKIILPFKAEVSPDTFMGIVYNPDEITTTETQTIIEYSVEFAPNSCANLALLVTKTKKADKSAILNFIQKDSLINSLYENRKTRAALRPV